MDLHSVWKNHKREKIKIEKEHTLTNNWTMIVTMAAVMTTTMAKMIIRINILGSLSDMLGCRGSSV